jgi:hypothetical protein
MMEAGNGNLHERAKCRDGVTGGLVSHASLDPALAGVGLARTRGDFGTLAWGIKPVMYAFGWGGAGHVEDGNGGQLGGVDLPPRPWSRGRYYRLLGVRVHRGRRRGGRRTGPSPFDVGPGVDGL